MISTLNLLKNLPNTKFKKLIRQTYMLQYHLPNNLLCQTPENEDEVLTTISNTTINKKCDFSFSKQHLLMTWKVNKELK